MPDNIPPMNLNHPGAASDGATAKSHPPAPGGATVVELRVRNHPGAMSHITGLFARRAYNLEAIVCVPESDRGASRMLLLVADDPKLEQMQRQLAKLFDVLEVRLRADIGAGYFAALRW